ncbi:beta strand repeat-containing protein, partial [Flavobacterium polysaccharolyticum]
MELSNDSITSERFLDYDKVKSKKNNKKSSVLPDKKLRNNASTYAVTSIDLNGPALGVNNDVLVNAAGSLYFIANFNNQIITTTGTATSARITFSSNTNGVPAGVPNPANEVLYVYNAAGTTLLGTYQISTASATTYDIVLGTNTLRISHTTANVFDITEVFGQPILVDNLEIMLRNQYYNHTNPAIGDTRRYAVISVTDPDTTLSAYARLTTGSDPVAVNDTNAVAANSATAVTGNLLTNDTDATVGDARTITEVHGYTSSVGAVYTSTYGTITVQSNGAYSYNVDVNNATVKGLKNGNSITDIISYQVTDNVGNFDFGYLTVTINGVTEPPVATNNTNTVTVGTSTVATGNVISDDSGLGSDKLDRNTSLFVWESQYTSGATVNGTTRTVGGVNVSFVQNTPAGVAGALNQTVNFGTNGGHTGYFLFASDPAVNPAGDNRLTINFSKPVTNISFALSDIDFNQTNIWQDQMRVLGSLAGANVNYNKQVAGSIQQTGSDTFYGTGSVPATDAHGNVTISFNSPIDKLEFYYNYGPNVTAADPGGQLAGLTDLVWQDDEASGVLLVNGLTTNVGVPVAGTYGTFIIYANGSYTYTLNSSSPAVLALTSGQTLTDSIPYSISDNIPGSGNIASANLIITITCTPPVAPTVTTGAATCASPGTATITNYDSSFTYTFTPAGPTVGAGGVISNLTPNTSYTVTATVGGGGCISNASSAFSVSPSQTPSAPVVGAITQPSCSVATGSVVLSGLPSSGTWTVTASPGGETVTSTGTTTTFSGLTAGITYTFTVTNASSCTSSLSTNAVIYNRLCANNDSFTDAGGSVIQNDFINGVVVTTTNTDVTPVTNGPLSIDANGNLTIAPGTTPGTYTITYTICETANLSNCTTATVSVLIVDSDGDGVYDSSDLDDDNDGILDTVECTNNLVNLNSLVPLINPGGTTNIAVGDRFYRANALRRLGITYDAIVNIISLQLSGGGTLQLSGGAFNLNSIVARTNPYVVYRVDFVPAGSGASTTGPYTPVNIGKLQISSEDIDGNGDATLGEVSGFSNALTTTSILPGSNITGGGFDLGLSGLGGPGTGFSYYRPVQADGVTNVPNGASGDNNYKLVVSFDNYTSGDFVYGATGPTTIGVTPNTNPRTRGMDFRVRSLYGCDNDGDGISNELDLDSDNDVCSDANEYYNNITSAASGQQFGQTGGATAPVNANGTVNLPAASYTGSYTNAITSGTASTISTQPADVSILAGTNTTFSTSVSGGSGVTQHQWQVSTDNGTSWTNITNGGVYSNATTATLTITAATVAMNGYDYRDVITESNFVCGTVTSASGNLCVIQEPTLSSNSTVCSGADAIFTITGTAGNTVTYSGAASGTATIGAGGTVAVTVTGVTADTTLNLSNVSDGSCNRSLTATATVTVNALPVAATVSSNSPVCSGSDAIFTITGTAGNTVTYSGAASGTATIGAGGTVAVTVTGVTADTTLNLSNVSDGSCNRSLTATATVTVNPLPASNLVLNGTSPICSGTGTNITVASSVVGVNYQLRTGTTNVGTVVAGDGGTINLPTGNLTATTTFNVLATNATTSCSIQLTETEEVTVTPTVSIAAFSPATSTRCQGAGAVTTTTTATNSTGITYSLDAASL